MGDVQIHWQEDPASGVLTATASWTANGAPMSISASGSVRGVREKLTQVLAPKLKQVIAALRTSPVAQQQAISGQLAQINKHALNVTKKHVAKQLTGKMKHALSHRGAFFPHASAQHVAAMPKTAAALTAAQNVVAKAKAGHPAAKSFVKSVVQKAAQGAPDAKALASVLSQIASSPAAAAGCGVSGAASINPIYAAQQVYLKAKRGDAKSKTFIASVLSKANAGDAQARVLRDVLAQASKLGSEEHAPHHAVSGMAGDSLFQHAAPMNVKNYYTISGQDIGPFWGDNVVDSNPTLEIAVGANGEAMKKRWDGARWVWEQIRVHEPIRNSNAIFSTRDAYLQGSAAMQARALS